jgi:hypothetical protein
LISKGQILSINPFWYFYHKPRIYHKTRSLVGNSLDGCWGWRSWVCIFRKIFWKKFSQSIF